MSDLIQKADHFAEYWFLKQDQRRKYTNEPYMVHPREVAEIVKSVPHDENMICAALLHDTVEDTPVTIDEIYKEFNQDIGGLVGWLTDVSKFEDGTRKIRKAIDRAHTAQAPARAQTVKICDLISNSKSIVALDPNFARIYIPEKQLVLDVLTKGDKTLRKKAQDIIDEYNSLKVGAVVVYKTSKESEVGIITDLSPAEVDHHGHVTVLYPDGVPALRSKRTGKIFSKPQYYVEHYIHDPSLFHKVDADATFWNKEKWQELRDKINKLDQNDDQVQLAQEELKNLRVRVAIQKAESEYKVNPRGFEGMKAILSLSPEEWKDFEKDLKDLEAQSPEIAKAAQQCEKNFEFIWFQK